MNDCGLCSAYSEDYRVVIRNSDAVSVVITNPAPRQFVVRKVVART